MITISLCMIVKNEERLLKRCLDSIADLMDELIIVDTGSMDRTKEVAREYTNHIYDFKWTHDFSAARNYAFSKATKEYIYVADADEVVDDKNRRHFLKLKQFLLPEIEIVQMYYCNQLQFGTAYNFDKEYRPKLYKRIREFVWIEPIHEMVRLDPVIYDSEIEIMHLPECNHSGRDFKIFLNMYHSGQPLSARLHHMYAMELFISGKDEDFTQAKPVFINTLSDKNRSEAEYKEAFCVLAKVNRIQGDIPELFKNALKEVASNPCSELCFELGEYYYGIEDYYEAVIWYYNAAFEAESILNIQYSKHFPLQALVQCYKKLGDKEQEEHYKNMLRRKEV